MIKFFIVRKVSTTMFYSALLLLGAISLSKLQVTLLPSIVIPKVTILTSYPNVSPSEIENLVTKPIENTISSVNGVSRVESKSEEGLSIVTATFAWGYDINLGIISMRQKLDMAKNIMPQDVSKSIIIKFDPNDEPIMEVFAKPKKIPYKELRDYIDRTIKPEIERAEGVATVNIYGGEKREINVQVDSKKIFSSKLSLEELVRIIGSSNYNFPAGNVTRDNKEFTVRLSGEFKKVRNIEDVVVALSKEGVPIYLKSIAAVIDGYKEKKGTTMYNGKEAVILAIHKEPSKNTVAVSEKLNKTISELNQKFSKYVAFQIISDKSTYIKNAIENVRNNAIFGCLIAFFVLLLFLGNLKSAIIIVISIPVAITTTLIMMFLAGISLNVMSLGGLALGVGMLVDNSIVVLESIHNEFQKNNEKSQKKEDTAYTAILNVKSSCIASTLTSVIVFLPIIFVQGIAGEIFKELALTVSFSLLSSLLCAMTLIPMLSTLDFSKPFGKFSRFKNSRNRLTTASAFIENKLENSKTRYEKILAFTLARIGKTLILGTSITIIGVLGINFLKKELFVQIDRHKVEGFIETAPGTTLEKNIEISKTIDAIFRKNNMIKDSIIKIGYDEDNINELLKGKRKANFIETKFFLNKDVTSSLNFIELMSKYLSNNDKLKYSFEMKGDILENVLGKGSDRVEIQISSQNEERNRIVADYFYKIIKTAKELDGKIISVDASSHRKTPEVQALIDREKMASFGLQAMDIARLLKTAISGNISTQFRDGDREIPVRLQISPKDRDSPDKLKKLYVYTPYKELVQLSQTVKFIEGQSKSVILRKESKKMELLSIRCKENKKEQVLNLLRRLKNNRVNKFIMAVNEKTQDKAIMEPIQVDILEKNKETMDSLKQLLFTFLLSSVLIYMLLASQFESFLHPFSIALSIPLMLPGIVFALLITNNSISIISGMGLIMLLGIVVNNSIVLYEYIRQNQKQKGGKNNIEDIIQTLKEAGKARIRPILLTSLTTILGLIPMALGFGEGGELQSPLAIVVLFGLSFSFILTLVYFPAIFLAFEKTRIKLSFILGQKK